MSLQLIYSLFHSSLSLISTFISCSSAISATLLLSSAYILCFLLSSTLIRVGSLWYAEGESSSCSAFASGMPHFFAIPLIRNNSCGLISRFFLCFCSLSLPYVLFYHSFFTFYWSFRALVRVRGGVFGHFSSSFLTFAPPLMHKCVIKEGWEIVIENSPSSYSKIDYVMVFPMSNS